MSSWIAGDVILAGFVEIWPNHGEISPDLTEISPNLTEISPDLVKSGLDLDEISLGLMGFQVIFAGELQIPPVFVSFRRKSFEYRWRFWFYDRVGWLGF